MLSSVGEKTRPDLCSQRIFDPSQAVLQKYACADHAHAQDKFCVCTSGSGDSQLLYVTATLLRYAGVDTSLRIMLLEPPLHITAKKWLHVV